MSALWLAHIRNGSTKETIEIHESMTGEWIQISIVVAHDEHSITSECSIAPAHEQSSLPRMNETHARDVKFARRMELDPACDRLRGP